MSTRRGFALTAPLLLVLLCRDARADESPPRERCAGTYSLASPLPDRCLGEIDTDRPHQTDTPHVVPAGHTQVESAIVAMPVGGSIEARGAGRAAHLVLFDDGYKFGLVSHVDLQLLVKHVEYVPAERRFAPPGPLSVRAKLNVVEERGWVPAITLVPWVFVPFDRSQALRGGPLVFWGWELPAPFELEMNAGVLASGRPKPPAAVVVASALTYTIVGTFRVFVDVYATGWDVALGTGALWAFTRDAQLDLGTYVGLSGDEPVATPFLGFSARR